MKAQINLIATDLDGTILIDGLPANESDFIALRDVQKYGIPVVIVTGQAYSTAIRTAKRLNIEQHLDLIIASNGAMVSKVSTFDPIMTRPVERKIIAELDAFLTPRGHFMFGSTMTQGQYFINANLERDFLADNYAWFHNLKGIYLHELPATEQILQAEIMVDAASAPEVEQILQKLRDHHLHLWY